MTSTIESSSTVQRRTRVRFVVVGMAVLLGMVSYLDRACLGTLARPIMGDLHLADYELGYAQIAFALAYGMFGIISAWWSSPTSWLAASPPRPRSTWAVGPFSRRLLTHRNVLAHVPDVSAQQLHRLFILRITTAGTPTCC